MPLSYCGAFFQLKDRRLSRWWVVQSESTDSLDDSNDFEFKYWFAPPFWNSDFHYWLIEGDSNKLQTFEEYAEKLRLEFPHPDISTEARRLDEGWVMCPECTESWRAGETLALCRCPDCARIWENPYWQEGQFPI